MAEGKGFGKTQGSKSLRLGTWSFRNRGILLRGLSKFLRPCWLKSYGLGNTLQ